MSSRGFTPIEPTATTNARMGPLLLLLGMACSVPGRNRDDTTTFGPPPGTSTGMIDDDSSTGAPPPETSDGSTGLVDDSTSSGSTGEPAVCGNGIVEGDEECDDGPDNGNTQACTSACLQAVCGDGLLWVGEEGCDDEGESETCDADCTPAVCGDGTINPTAGEDCEADGPGLDCMACVASCLDGFADCNGDMLGDGCETDITTTATCGDCMTSCAVDETCINQTCVPPASGMYLLTERNSPNIWQWEPATGMTTLYHSNDGNDVDCNLAEGSASGWLAWHLTDYFAPFTPGAGMGTDATYGTPYAYPKHITVFDGQIVVMSRNDATIHWYSTAGMSLGSLATGNGTGQGMATDGSQLWASFWNGASSHFVRYDAAFTPVEMIANPAGLGANVNVVDFAFDGASGNFFGIVTNSEGGTGTQSNTVVQFSMGGMVIDTYMIPFFADGIGQSQCP